MTPLSEQSGAMDERILVLAPTGRDADLACRALVEAGIRAEVCEDIEDLCRQFTAGAGAAIVAKETMTPHGLRRLEETLAAQQTWSDLPIVILTAGGAATVENTRALAALCHLGNTTLLERPLRVATLISSVQVALRARHRQYEVRDHLLERERQQEELREAAHREQALRADAQIARDSLEMVLASIRDSFFTLDRESRYTYVNPKVTEITGISREGLLGRKLAEVFPHLIGSAVCREFHRAISDRVPVQFEYYNAVSGRWYDFRTYPSDTGISVFTADITDRKMAEEERDELLAQQQRIAETLQRSLLITPADYNFAGVEISSQYEAAWAEAQVGGDFYDAFRIDDTMIALVVGDVVGKGLVAAAHTAEVKFALRTILREQSHPAIALERLNNILVDTQRLESKSQDTLVAMSIAVVDTLTGHASVAAASAEPPLLVRANGTAEETPASGLVLGACPKTIYNAATVELDHGDVLLLVTDGVTEARRGREFFGYEGFTRAALQAHAARVSLEAMGESIIAEAKSFAVGALHDDICLLLMRLL